MKRLLYIFSFFLFSVAARAQTEPAVHAELLTDRETVESGGEFWLALKLDLARGGHVYWKNAGDAGEPVELRLELPDGFTEMGRYWPAPEKFSTGPFTEYGYGGRAFVLVKVKAPEKLTAGALYGISAKASWLACFSECIPMARDLDTLVVAGTGGAQNEEVARMVARLPETGRSAAFFETPDTLILETDDDESAASAYFFPAAAKVLTHSAPQTVKKADGKLYLFMKKAPAEEYAEADAIDGTLVFYNVQGERVRSFDIVARKTHSDPPVFAEPVVWGDFWAALALAFAGGMLLNLMPCVFPVLSLKAFRLLKPDGAVDAADRRRGGMFYTAGVIGSFLVVGALLVCLRDAGSQMGWGFQLQYPPFVLGLCLFLFFLGLVFSDVVCVGERLSAFSMNIGRNWGDFGTGVLAVLAATPCAAPFMGTALGYGLMNPAPVTFGVFTAMGAGMALPFLMLDLHPALGRFLPKAGAWTMLLKRILAFPLYAAAAWLLWVLSAQGGAFALGVGLSCVMLVAFAAWLVGNAERTGALKRTAAVAAVIALFLSVAGMCALSPARMREKQDAQIAWRPYDTGEIQEYRKAGVPVFIKFSAKWCLTCLVNERAAFSSGALKEAFRAKGVAAFAADWTERGDDITAALESFGRGGIPLYVYYAPHAARPQILPQLITEKTVLRAIGDL